MAQATQNIYEPRVAQKRKYISLPREIPVLLERESCLVANRGSPIVTRRWACKKPPV